MIREVSIDVRHLMIFFFGNLSCGSMVLLKSPAKMLFVGGMCLKNFDACFFLVCALLDA